MNFLSERGYLVRTSASCPGVPGSNPIAAPKSYEVYPDLGILADCCPSKSLKQSFFRHNGHEKASVAIWNWK